MTTETIDHGTLSRLVEAGAIRAAHVIGQAGGWALSVKYGMAEGAATEPEWTPYNRAEYQSRCRSICETISICIARSVANTLIAGSKALSSRRLVGATPSP